MSTRKSKPARPPAPDREAPARYAALDGLRGICACLVALYHWRGQLGYLVNSHIATIPLVANAYLFVDFFFVLSGFVIAARYQDALADRAVRFTDFVALRLGRLLPLQLFTLVLAVVLARGLYLRPYHWIEFNVPPETVSLKAFVLNAFLLHGMHTTKVLTWNHPSWSISVEFWTYMAFALAWLALRKRALLFAIATLIAMPVLLVRLAGQMNTTYDWGFLRSMLGFAVGVIVLNLVRLPRVQAMLSSLARAKATIIEVIVTIAVAAFVGIIGLDGFKAVSIAAPFVFGVAVTVFSAQRGALSSVLSSRPGEALGRWSYSIYLLQFPLQELMMFFALYLANNVVNSETLFAFPAGTRPQLGPTPLFGDFTNLLMLVIVIGAAALTYRWIEAPGRERVRSWVATRRDRRS